MGERRTHVLAALLLLMVLGSEIPARGAFPGGNGRIAFSRTQSRTGADLYSINSDGSGLETLRADCGDDVQVEWGPGGSKLVYLNNGFDHTGAYRYTVEVSDPAGSAPRHLGQGLYPSWSPDGARIAFASLDGNLLVTDAGAFAPTTIYDTDLYVRAVAWSPVGDQIAFVAGALGEPGDILSIKPDGTGLVTFVGSPDWEDDIEWSPDGHLLAFTRRVGSGLADVYLRDMQGGLTRLSDTPQINERSPAFSPDGLTLAYTESSASGPSRAIVLIDGRGNKVDVPNTAGAFGLDWQSIPTPSPVPTPSPSSTPMETAQPSASHTGGPAVSPSPSQSPCPGPSFPTCPRTAFSTCFSPPRSRARSVSLEALQARIRYGSEATLTGQISSETSACFAFQTVTIQQISPMPERNVVSVQAGGDGTFSASFAPSANASYIARADSSSDCDAAESVPVPIEVRVAVRLRSVNAPAPLTRLATSIEPCEGHEATKIVIQRRTQRGFRTVSTAVLDDECRARKTLRLMPGVYRARWPSQDDDHTSSVSRRIRVRA
ncbi:MAG TPA: hypothetical protein VNC78_09295 [Actinomycetota bacterium]|nr:hypothetical protein [Actinomycetota bacterium]